MSLESIKHLGYGGQKLNQDLLKVIAELQGLQFTVADGANANTLVAVAGMESEDTIAQIVNLTTPGAFSVANATIVDRRAKETVTVLSTAAEDDVVTVGGKAYTLKKMAVNITVNVPPFIVPITELAPGDIDEHEAAANLAKAIMSADSRLIASADGEIVTITYRTPGVGGNAITLAQTGDGFTLGHDHLQNGVDTTGCGFKTTDDTSTKKLLVVWYNKQ